MPTNLDNVITKLRDEGVQSRIRSAVRTATINELKKEGIELTPKEWGELTARLIAAKDDPATANFSWGDLLGGVLGPMLGSFGI